MHESSRIELNLPVQRFSSHSSTIVSHDPTENHGVPALSIPESEKERILALVSTLCASSLISEPRKIEVVVPVLIDSDCCFE
jgi:hypothetical protein